MTTELKPYPFEFIKRQARPRKGSETEHHGVVIVGGGVAGLTAALALAVQGIPSVVIEADDSVCFGSRAICISRRSLEIFERLGAVGEILEKGLPWTGGRSYYRNQEVLHFSMPHDANQHLPPMINIEQYYIEEYLVHALESYSELADIRWANRVTGVAPQDGGVMLDVEQEDGQPYRIQADWVMACDGGRSKVREALGLHLQGTAYEGIYIIADIALKSALPTERLAWFDPPSNPGSTILMHKQPDDIWRIDYQIRDDEDPQEAVKAENVLPRVQAHLEMIGETAEWSPLWISLYKANALTLDSYRHGRVLFAGDAAHLVPIFGVRGANSAIDDVDNMAWKLAAVMKGRADPSLLDSYSAERVFAARENLRQGMKSTEFMAPPTFAFQMMREAVLDLALDTPGVRSLINPRQTSAIHYEDSPAVAAGDHDARFTAGPRRGAVLQSAPLRHVDAQGRESTVHVTQLVRAGQFLVLAFGDAAGLPADLNQAVASLRESGLGVRALAVCGREQGASGDEYLVDPDGKVAELYGAQAGGVYVVRPDGHVFGRWLALRGQELVDAFAVLLGKTTQRRSA
jgi:3-(3-hydroxy-phenyl)propionate hydroxylase